MEQDKAFYPIQTIRKVGNIPLELFGLTMSEITLLIQIFGLSYVLGVILQIIAMSVMDNPPTIMYDTLILVPIMMYIIKYINKKYGKGLIFFMIASFKVKDIPKMNEKPVLKYTKL